MTKLLPSLLIVALLVVAGVWAYRSAPVSAPTQESSLPSFNDYAVDEVYAGEVAEVDFDTMPAARTFRTVINEGVERDGVNFAGSYSIVSWGCGTSCQSSAIVDVRTGEVVVYGIASSFGLAFSPESRLLVINPKDNIPEPELDRMSESSENIDTHYPLGSVSAVAEYYEFTGEELRLVGKYSVVTDEPQTCIQVVTPGRNPFTGEVREFPTPCDLPYGWEALETAEGGDI